MDIYIADTDELYKEIIDSKLTLKELLILGLKTSKIIKSKDIDEKNSSNLLVLNELQKLQTILGVSAKKGGISENIIMENICKYFPEAEVSSIGFESGKGDILVRISNISIMVEVKNYKLNTPTKEVDKFHRDLINNEYDASILVSINSGITGRNNKFSYDMIGNKFAVYLCNTGNDCLGITWAILFIVASLKLTKSIINENENNKQLIINFVETKLKLLQECIEDNSYINNSIIKMKIDLTRNIELATNHMLTSLTISKTKINDIIKSFTIFVESNEITNDLSLLYGGGQNKESLDEYSLADLKLKAKELKLTKYSKLGKSELLKLIENNI